MVKDTKNRVTTKKRSNENKSESKNCDTPKIVSNSSKAIKKVERVFAIGKLAKDSRKKNNLDYEKIPRTKRSSSSECEIVGLKKSQSKVDKKKSQVKVENAQSQFDDTLESYTVD